MSAFSLPTQRCFCIRPPKLTVTLLFSAYAEVFLPAMSSARTSVTFLCLRRGVSLIENPFVDRLFFSLPTQRCFPHLVSQRMTTALFSAYAEVFPSVHP